MNIDVEVVSNCALPVRLKASRVIEYLPQGHQQLPPTISHFDHTQTATRGPHHCDPHSHQAKSLDEGIISHCDCKRNKLNV